MGTLFKLLSCIAVFAVTGCGGGGASESSSSEVAGGASSSASSQALWAGRDIRVNNSVVVSLLAETGNEAAQWQQVQGPLATFLTGQGNPAQILTPDVSAPTELVFEVSSGGQSDQLSVIVEPCLSGDDMLFDECIAPGFGGWLAYESIPGADPFFHYQGQGDFHVQWQMVQSSDLEHGNVMQVSWNANDPSHQVNGRGWFGLALPGIAAENGADLTAYLDGALSFDMRLVEHEQPANAAGFIAKMECVYPCVSAEMPLANAHTSYEWQTHTLPVRQLVGSGLDIERVNHVLVIQPDWFQQEQTVTIELDNIKLSKEYQRPDPEPGCTGSGNVSYTLSRAANPSSDQQEAYALITSAMDVAVEKYNCYSNLSRHLTVQYNPDVATADGSTNGNIRFGSRASMHYVTAMHEIAHTFGAGGSNTFRSLVVDGVFQGSQATAKLREISGIATDQLKSDGTHFWPHGLNYISEGNTEQDLIHHCWMVEAIYADLTRQ